MKRATATQVAALFNAPIENVRAQYAKNAADLRAFAVKAGAGKYRGKTAAEWSAYADHAESQAHPATDPANLLPAVVAAMGGLKS